MYLNKGQVLHPHPCRTFGTMHSLTSVIELIKCCSPCYKHTQGRTLWCTDPGNQCLVNKRAKCHGCAVLGIHVPGELAYLLCTATLMR